MKMKLKFLLFTLFISSVILAQTKGTISGVLTDKEANNSTLPFANAMIKGSTRGTTTDENGKYTLTVDPGNYTIVFSFLGYENVEVPFSIAAGENLTISKSLGSGSYKLEDVVVKSAGGREKETALLLDQKKAVVIKQSIGAQELSRKGVSDVEEGLTKITGITKVGSRGLFVRGLEDRYNNLLINDLAAPTNNPFKKIIPLDLFPTDIVSVIEVYKTFNPDISGDFSGGTFNIATSLSGKSVTKISIGTGYATSNNLSRFQISKDANTTKGFFGLLGNDRELPGIYGTVPSNKSLTAAQSKTENNNGWDVDETSSPLNSSIGFLHSERFDLSRDRKISYLFSLNFNNSYDVRKGANNTINSNGEFDNNLLGIENKYKTSTSSLIGFNYKTNRANISFNTMYLRSAESLILDQYGTTDLNDTYKVIRTNQFEESNYLNGQIFGDYALTENKNHTLKAGGSFAKTSFHIPDRKFFSGAPQSNSDIITNYGANSFIKQYLDINGDYFYSDLLEYNWKFGAEKSNKLSVGYNGNGNKAETSYRFVYIKENTNVTSPGSFEVPLNSVDGRINSDFDNNSIYYAEGSNASYKTKLNEYTNAGYANLLLKFNALEISGGVRAEKYNREIQYKYNGKFSDPLKKKSIDKVYILPSLNVKYALNEKSNFRFAASQTYTKPILMEVLPITIVNADKTSQQGNPVLVNSDNLNVDLKYELFPTAKELLVIGAFGKRLTNPIERTYKADAGGQITTFLNSNYANLYGVELEMILELKRIHENLADFSFGFNTSIMQTQVKVKDSIFNDVAGKYEKSIETHPERALQGASKWIVNSDLKYQFDFNKKWNNTISLIYSVFGKRIYSVGTNKLDHIYELPVHKLDFVWNNKLGEQWNLKFSADNLLNPKEKFVLGDDNFTPIYDSKTIQDYKRGIGLSLNLSYTF